MKVRTLVVAVLLVMLAIYSLLRSSGAIGAELHLLEPREVSIEHTRYDTYDRLGVRDPYLAPLDKDLKFGMGFNIDTDLVKYDGWRLYLDNKTYFDSAASHVRHGGLIFETGFSTPYVPLDVFYSHHSRHIMEDTRLTRFPVYDAIGIRINIIGGH